MVKTEKMIVFFLNKIVIGKESSSQVSDFSSISNDLLNFINYVKYNKLSNQIVFHSHTHGKGRYADIFSLEDMAAYILIKDVTLYKKIKL